MIIPFTLNDFRTRFIFLMSSAMSTYAFKFEDLLQITPVPTIEQQPTYVSDES
jgi:hypothetical protein